MPTSPLTTHYPDNALPILSGKPYYRRAESGTGYPLSIGMISNTLIVTQTGSDPGILHEARYNLPSSWLIVSTTATITIRPSENQLTCHA